MTDPAAAPEGVAAKMVRTILAACDEHGPIAPRYAEELVQPILERVEEIRLRRERHADLLDVGGTEVALIGSDIDWLSSKPSADQALGRSIT